LSRPADAIADFQAAQSIDPADALSKTQLALIAPAAASTTAPAAAAALSAPQ
jgi:hypothetical protein